MTAPRPMPYRLPKPNQLQGDRQLAEMSFASSIAEEQVSSGREILVMTVDLGQGRKDKLIVHENEKPEDLAASFCRRYNLSERLCGALTANIRANLEEVKDEEEQRGNSTEEADNKPSESGVGKFSPAPGGNVGERLYVKGMQMKGAADLQMLRARHQQEETVQKQLTFAPKISRGPQQSRSTDDLARPQSPATTRELELKRREQLLQQASECTFSPAVNPKYPPPRSEEIERKKSREGPDRFETLYRHAEVRKAKAEHETEEFLKSHYPFHPVLEAEQQLESEPQSVHMEKLYSSRRAVEAQLDRERVRLMGKFDPHTGRELFKPKTGRPPTLPVSRYAAGQEGTDRGVLALLPAVQGGPGGAVRQRQRLHRQQAEV